MKQQIITLLENKGLLNWVSTDTIEEIEDDIQEIVNSFCSKCNK